MIASWKSPRRTRRDGWLRRTRIAVRSRGAWLPAWALACVFMAAIAALDAAAQSDATPDVNEAKANMLWNIAKFVEWPALPENKSQPLVVTILGEDDLAADLAGLLSSRTVNGRPVFVRFARRPQDALGSQILYLAASESSQIVNVLSTVDKSAVLTVSTAEVSTAASTLLIWPDSLAAR